MAKNKELEVIIKNEVNRIKKEENFSTESRAFIVWVLENFFDVERNDALSHITDHPEDKRIDAYLEYGDDKIVIIQCKYPMDTNKVIGDTEVALFKGCLDWLRQPEEISELNIPTLIDLSELVYEKWDTDTEIELHFFNFGQFNDQANRERRVFNNKKEHKNKVQMLFHDAKDIITTLKGKIQAGNPLEDEEVILNVIDNQVFFRKSDNGFNSYVATIKGKELAELYNDYENALFYKNIRFFRGAKKGTINNKIIETAKNKERNKFWYFNNGVTITCTKVNPIGDDNIKALKLTGFQIINGCQTTVSLSNALDSIKSKSNFDEIEILVRIIEAPLAETDLITLYTNSQNAVSEKQLRANDPVQLSLKESFLNLNPKCLYITKDGEKKYLTNSQKKDVQYIIEMEKAAQINYSFLYDPAFARRYTKQLFSSEYHTVFPKDITPEEILLPFRIFEEINRKIQTYRVDEYNPYKNAKFTFSDTRREEILSKEFLIYSNLIILHIIYFLIKSRYKQYNRAIAKKLLTNKLEARVSELFDYIVSVLRFSTYLNKENNVQRFLKNKKNIDLLVTEVVKEVEKDKAKKNDTLKDILPNI
jgi:hypothetical protein